MAVTTATPEGVKKDVPVVPLTRTELDNLAIKRVFKDNDKLLLAMRAVMLGLGANDGEKKMVRDAFQDRELLAAVSQRFLPRIRKDEPLGNLSEVWGGTEKMVFGFERDTIAQALQYKQLGIQMLREAINLLVGPDLPGPSIEVVIDVEADPLAIQLLGRNQFIKAVEEQLVGLKIVASQKDLTPAEKKAAAAKDSVE